MFICPGTPQYEHGFQDSGLRGHPEFTIPEDSTAKPQSSLKLILSSAKPQESAGRRDRTGLGSPLAPMQALPWTWRPNSSPPLATLCPGVASREPRKKTPFLQFRRPAEGRQADGGFSECLFPLLLLPSHRKSRESSEEKFHLPSRLKRPENKKIKCFLNYLELNHQIQELSLPISHLFWRDVVGRVY